MADQTQSPNVVLHIVAPIAAIGATMVLRRVMNSGYRAVTGSAPPDPRDGTSSWARAITWAALTAATAAVVEVVVYRLTSGETTQPTVSETSQQP